MGILLSPDLNFLLAQFNTTILLVASFSMFCELAEILEASSISASSHNIEKDTSYGVLNCGVQKLAKRKQLLAIESNCGPIRLPFSGDFLTSFSAHLPLALTVYNSSLSANSKPSEWISG